MHEMALSEGVLQIVQDSAAREGFSRVKAVWLEIGALAGVDPEAMRFTFDAVTRGTVAEQATLEIVDVPGKAWCMPCGAHVAVRQRFDACPKCGSYQLQVVEGDEMKVKELEVE
ncbi:MAG: hydrogenase maturation nickel metallochaperone HypA [Pseudomonadota bacterium]